MTITSTRLIISFLLFILTISGQLNAQEEQEFPTDPVMSEKLKNIQTLEQLLEITENDRQASGVINDQREQKFLATRDRQKSLLEKQFHIKKLRAEQEMQKHPELLDRPMPTIQSQYLYPVIEFWLLTGHWEAMAAD